MSDYRCSDSNNYEQHVRSNEDLRDAMDGKLSEPMEQSQESVNNTNKEKTTANKGDN